VKVTVFDLAARYLLPSLRRAVAEELLSMGLSEARIAEILGVSRSLVSRYVRGLRGSRVRVDFDESVRSAVRSIAVKAVSGEASPEEIDAELAKLLAKLLAEKRMCRYHAVLDKTVNTVACNICTLIFAKTP